MTVMHRSKHKNSQNAQAVSVQNTGEQPTVKLNKTPNTEVCYSIIMLEPIPPPLLSWPERHN